MPIKEKKMCWRERFLTLRSSLITYTGKEFVYVIIFSPTASPKAATIPCCLPAPQPSATLPGEMSPRDGHEERCSAPATGPAPAPRQTRQRSQALVQTLCRKHLHRPQLQTPPAQALHLTYSRGHPRSRRASCPAAGTTSGTSHPTGRVPLRQ